MTTAETKPDVANSADPTVKAATSQTVKRAPAKAPKSLLPKAAPKAEKAPSPAKALKGEKVKMIRDSFTILKPEFAVLETLKLRPAKLATPVKKTELIRAGIKTLAALSDAAFIAAVRSVPNLKTGRPA
jgi:hypothetical protein